MDTRHWDYIDGSDDLTADGKVYFSKPHDLDVWDKIDAITWWRHPILWWQTRGLRKRMRDVWDRAKVDLPHAKNVTLARKL